MNYNIYIHILYLIIQNIMVIGVIVQQCILLRLYICFPSLLTMHSYDLGSYYLEVTPVIPHPPHTLTSYLPSDHSDIW